MKNKKRLYLGGTGSNISIDMSNKDKGLLGENNTFQRKKFLFNMPRKIGLPSGKKYFFIETKNGYCLNFGRGLWIGMPKILVENSPHLYTLVQKGAQR